MFIFTFYISKKCICKIYPARLHIVKKWNVFKMYIHSPNTGQLNPLFHTFAEFRQMVNSVEARQSTDWLATDAQSSPNVDIYFQMKISVN